MEIIVEDNQHVLHIVEEFEVINHNYKILIGTVTKQYTKYLFEITKYENDICISNLKVYGANTDLSKEINNIYMDYFNIECNVTTVKRDTNSHLYGMSIRPIYNTNDRHLVFYNTTGTTDMPYIAKFIHDYLSKHLYLFEIANEYVLK